MHDLLICPSYHLLEALIALNSICSLVFSSLILSLPSPVCVYVFPFLHLASHHLFPLRHPTLCTITGR